MKKCILLVAVIACVSCGEAKKETEAPVKNIRCDSVESVNIDSITGKQTFVKTWMCDSTAEAK